MRKIITGSLLMVMTFSVFAQKGNRQTERKLYLTQIKAAESLLRLNETAEAKKMLIETNPVFRGFEWEILNAMSDRSMLTLKGHSKNVVGIALSNDGKWLASGSADSTIILWDAVS